MLCEKPDLQKVFSLCKTNFYTAKKSKKILRFWTWVKKPET